MKHMLTVGSYLFLTGEIEPGHGVAYQERARAAGARVDLCMCPARRENSPQMRGEGAERTMWFRGLSSLGALEVYALSRLTHTFCHRDNSYTNYYN